MPSYGPASSAQPRGRCAEHSLRTECGDLVGALCRVYGSAAGWAEGYWLAAGTEPADSEPAAGSVGAAVVAGAKLLASDKMDLSGRSVEISANPSEVSMNTTAMPVVNFDMNVDLLRP